MSQLSVTLIAKDYDHLAPLAAGDVRAEGLDLRLDRDTAAALDRTLADKSILVGELSFARHIARLDEGDLSFVGIPVFPTRAFRHRSFFVRRDSGMSDLKDLVGKRVGTNEWPATGNTWSRATLREQGIRIDSIQWWVGLIEGASADRPQGALPPYVQEVTSGRSLADMLIAGELDALMSATPKGFYQPDFPIVRLIPDYRRAEQEYYRRTGVYPAHHIIGIRRELFERHPWVARSLFLALDESKNHWQQSRLKLIDTTPWILTDLEETAALMGDNWHAYGVDPNRHMIQTLCDELYAQDLIKQPMKVADVFAEFKQVTISS